MVLDVKMMTWAVQNELDTAKLKAAKVPIYGKWYFPELPAGVTLVNLDTGERRSFPERLQAGEVLWVSERDLRAAGLSPFDDAVDADTAEPSLGAGEVAAVELEPLLLMARSPYDRVRSIDQAHPPAGAGREWPIAVRLDEYDPESIHLPMASIAPLLLAFGIAIALVGTITHVLVLAIGLLWVLLGAVGWIKVGLAEARGRDLHAEH